MSRVKVARPRSHPTDENVARDCRNGVVLLGRRSCSFCEDGENLDLQSFRSRLRVADSDPGHLDATLWGSEEAVGVELPLLILVIVSGESEVRTAFASSCTSLRTCLPWDPFCVPLASTMLVNGNFGPRQLRFACLATRQQTPRGGTPPGCTKKGVTVGSCL